MLVTGRGAGLQAAVGSLESAEDCDEPSWRMWRGQVRNLVGARDQQGFWRCSWEKGSSRLALASCMAHATQGSEPPWGAGNANGICVCGEARQRLCWGEMQGWGERKRHRGRHSPQSKIKMSQLYQLMTRGGPGRCQHFCFAFWKIPSVAHVPKWKTTAAEATNTATHQAGGRAGETSCFARQQGHAARHCTDLRLTAR